MAPRRPTKPEPLHGRWFGIEHAMLHLYEAEAERFVALTETELDRLLQG